jgi:hypothetical protein
MSSRLRVALSNSEIRASKRLRNLFNLFADNVCAMLRDMQSTRHNRRFTNVPKNKAQIPLDAAKGWFE